MATKENTITLPDRSNHLANYPRDLTTGYRPNIIAANRGPRREAGCIYGDQYRYDLSTCSQCPLDTVRSCVHTAYWRVNISAGKSHDGKGNLLLDYLDNERYLLDPETMTRLIHPVTLQPIKIVDLSKAFAVLRQAYHYEGEETSFAPNPPSYIKEEAA